MDSRHHRRRSALSSVAVLVSLGVANPALAAEPPPPPSAASPQACEGESRDAPSRGVSMFNAGLGLTVTGLAVGLVIGAPALLLRKYAREDADGATYEARQRSYAQRADRRGVVAFSAIGVGGAMLLVGIPLIVLGSRAKNSNRAAVAPLLSPTMAGVNARVRF